MELQTEASVFWGGAPGDRVSNGNVPHLYSIQSAARTAGPCGSVQISSALLLQVSRRRTRAHQPHHGPLSRGGLVFTQPSNGTLLLPDDVIVSPPTERTNQELLSNIPLCPELSASKEQPIQQPVPYFYSEKKLFLVSLLA